MDTPHPSVPATALATAGLVLTCATAGLPASLPGADDVPRVEWLREHAVAFRSIDPRRAKSTTRPWTLPPAEEGSFEALCVRAGLENAFVPMRGIAADAWLREPLSSRPLGHSPMRAPWPEVLDAMVFTRVMSRSTSAPIVVEKNVD